MRRGIWLKISSRTCSVSMLRALIGTQDCVVQSRNCQTMIALDIKTLAAIRHRPDKNSFPRPIVIARIGLRSFVASVALQGDEVKDRRGELADIAVLLMGDVAGHGQGLQVDLRGHDRRAEIQQYTSF